MLSRSSSKSLRLTFSGIAKKVLRLILHCSLAAKGILYIFQRSQKALDDHFFPLEKKVFFSLLFFLSVRKCLRTASANLLRISLDEPRSLTLFLPHANFGAGKKRRHLDLMPRWFWIACFLLLLPSNNKILSRSARTWKVSLKDEITRGISRMRPEFLMR